jgi:hypothetical protein
MNSFFEFCGNMIFLGGTMALGAFIASFIVSQTMYSKTQFEEKAIEIEEQELSEEEEDPEFEALYSLEDKEIRELDDAEKEALKNKHCSVDTPAGSVLMTFAEPHFIYYAKSGSIIPYRFLDVVARKFVLDFDCLGLYNKLEEEKKEEVVPAEEKKEGTKKEETKKEENSVFVVKKKKITQKKRLVKKSMNRFKYGGQIADYEKEKERRELEPKEAPKKLTFSDYKKMMKNE